MTTDKFLYLKERGEVTATTTEAALSEFNPLNNGNYRVVINHAAYTGYVAGTAQWTIAVEASSDGTTYSTIASFVSDGTAGRKEFLLSPYEINQVVSGAKFMRVRATKTGSPGNLTYAAYILPL